MHVLVGKRVVQFGLCFDREKGGLNWFEYFARKKRGSFGLCISLGKRVV